MCTYAGRNPIRSPSHVFQILYGILDLREQRLHVDFGLAPRKLRHASLELLKHLKLPLGDVKHDLEVPDYTPDLTLKLAFFSDVKERDDQVTQAVVDVSVCQPGEDPSPLPVLFGAE